MRWIGAGLVVLSCTSLGFQTAWQWRMRLRWLEQLRQMIYFLKGEILYGHTALNEALDRVGQRCLQAEGERGLRKLPLFSFLWRDVSTDRRGKPSARYGGRKWRPLRSRLLPKRIRRP